MTRADNHQPPPSLADAEWLAAPETRAVLAALAAGGFEGRIVGGAVRNALIGQPVKDIDIATPALPEDVIRLAEAAGLRAIATGIDHGTVTAVAHHRPFEVTTLRRDIETFGRHARVTFTDDWAEDAARRDFTINALYCDAAGTVHDPLGGYPDLTARRVRFIGEAADRIREDYLRILRFFRFTAEYAQGAPDPIGLAASVAAADGLDQLSAERIRAELFRLLAAPRAVAIVALIVVAGLIDRLVGTPGAIPAFASLAAIEARLDRSPDALLRLAALAAPKPGAATAALASRLKLSNSESDRLARAALPDPALSPEAQEREARVFLYRFGAEAFSDAMLLAWARSGADAADALWSERFALAHIWKPPVLPVRGGDLLEAGLAQGPAIGRIVRAFEDWWISEDFPSNELRLARKLSDLVKANRS